MGGHLFLTKVVPRFASGNGVICLFKINEDCVHDEPTLFSETKFKSQKDGSTPCDQQCAVNFWKLNGIQHRIHILSTGLVTKPAKQCEVVNSSLNSSLNNTYVHDNTQQVKLAPSAHK